MAIKQLSTQSVKNGFEKKSNFYGGIVRDNLKFFIDARRASDASNSITDLSGNGYTATKTSGLSVNSAGYFDFADDPHVSKYILVPKETILDSTSWTFEWWIRPSVVGDSKYWFHAGQSPMNRHLLGISTYNTETNRMFVFTGNVNSTTSDLGGANNEQPIKLYSNTVHHYVASLSTSGITHYIDGVPFVSLPAGTLSSPTGSDITTSGEITASCGTTNNSYWIGQELDSDGTAVGDNPFILDANQSFRGRMYSARLYSKALSSSEVLQNYNAGVLAL